MILTRWMTHGTDPKDARSRAEAQFSKKQVTDRESRALIDTDLQATRKKTAKLRAERLAREAREGITDLDRKEPPTKRK